MLPSGFVKYHAKLLPFCAMAYSPAWRRNVTVPSDDFAELTNVLPDTYYCWRQIANAQRLLALFVLLMSSHFVLRPQRWSHKAHIWRFFRIAMALPLELQGVLARRYFGLDGQATSLANDTLGWAFDI